MTFILTTNSAREQVARHAGGKGHNLWLLSQRGAPVPPFFVVGTPAFERFLKVSGVQLGEDARERIVAAEVPQDVQDAVRAALVGVTMPVAVRSSALAEDSALHSFAGQLQTFLYVQDADSVIDAMKRCWASAFSEHAVAYMKHSGLDPLSAKVGVVVQTMVDADAAGVAFTVDPTNGDAETMVISSVWGLGEGLVSGLLDSDDVRVRKSDRAIVDRKTAAKDVRLVRAAAGGLREEPVPTAQRDAFSLTDTQIDALAVAALRIEHEYGVPQDIEWAVAHGALYILQARPVTTAVTSGKPIQIWDNSNIIESYFGVTSPLTFTFARNAYHHVYVQFCDVMGVPRGVTVKSDGVLKNMLGYVDGRIYYNLLNWYHLIGLFPGFKHNKGFMEGMMGVRESLPKDAQALLQVPPPATLEESLRQKVLALSMARRFFTLDTIVGDFKRHFDRNYDDWRHIRFSGKPFEELLMLMRQLEGIFLANWKAPIINDFFAMMAFGALRKFVKDWGLDASGTLQNDLLCGEGGVESAVPTEMLIEMAIELNRRPAQRAVFTMEPVASLQRRVADEGDYGWLKERIADYVDRYGFRCMNELKLEERDLHADPTFIYQALQNYVQHPPPTVADLRAREQGIRASAEAKVKGALSGVRAVVFRWVLGHARKTVKNRENLRLCRTKVFGLARRIFDGIGENLHARGRLDHPRDVYFLERDELWSLIEASATTQDLKGTVALRKVERERFLTSEPPDDRFVTRGAVYFGNSYKKPQAVVRGDGILTGTGCCPGIVRAPAKVIRDPRGDLSLKGQILVAERTDPGWTPLFPSASGVLVERGSLLSHSAIVARELGIPCVVGIAGLLATVKSGEDVELDGATGVVRLHGPVGGVATPAAQVSEAAE